MKQEEDFFKDFVRGEIEVLHIHEDGREEILLHKKNLILNSASDLVAKAVAGELRINGMYMAYRNDGGDAQFPVDITLAPGDFLALPTNSGFVRVPTISRPEYAASELYYVNNQVKFTAITDSNPVVPTANNTITDGVSMFYGASLAFVDPGTDPLKDVLVAGAHFDNGAPIEFPKIAGAQLAVRWTLTFKTPQV